MQKISKFDTLKIKRLDKKTPRQKQFLNWNKIHKILLIIDIDNLNFNEIKQIPDLLKNKNVQTILISSNPNISTENKFNLALKKHFTFFNYLKSNNLDNLLKESYDTAIAYSNGELWAMAMLLAQTRSKLRISNAQEIASITDITIMPKNNSLSQFISQIIKYLQTIKPGKNA